MSNDWVKDFWGDTMKFNTAVLLISAITLLSLVLSATPTQAAGAEHGARHGRSALASH